MAHIDEAKILPTLRELIGARGHYQNTEYELIEILEHGPSLVLRDCSDAHSIQADLHGEARRVVSKTHTVSLLNEAHDNLHPVLLTFFEPGVTQDLLKLLQIN